MRRGRPDEVIREFVVADGIVELLRHESGMRDDRFFRVRKLRGSSYREGMHALRLTAAGVEVYRRLVPGTFVSKGQTLFRIDARDYVLALQRAQAELQSAESALSLERGQQQIAKREWQILGTKVLYFERKEDGGFRSASEYEELALTADDVNLAGAATVTLDEHLETLPA